MRKAILSSVLIAFLAIFAYGCSDNTQDDVRDLGQDIKRDVKEGVNDANRAIQDAAD